MSVDGTVPQRRRPGRRLLPAAAAAGAVAAVLVPSVVGYAPDGRAPLLRVAETLPANARTAAHPLVMTLGGPVYCAQATPIAVALRGSLLCPDYGQNGERSTASRGRRVEDWGDQQYLDAVARLPGELRQDGVKVSELVLVGASYAAYAVAELAATHPELHPRALIIVDGFLDLPERFRALRPGQPTRTEIIRALGGTLAERPRIYRRRSPSHHLAGLAAAVRRGMRLVDVWSVAPSGAREFNGAMCSLRSNALWLERLAGILHRPLQGYVTQLPHAYALWDWWRQPLRLARLAPAEGIFPGIAVAFRPDAPVPPTSYCASNPEGWSLADASLGSR